MNDWTDKLFSPIDVVTAEVVSKTTDQVNEDLVLLIKYLSAAFRLGNLFVIISDETICPDPCCLARNTAGIPQGEVETFFIRLRNGFSSFPNQGFPHIVKQGNRLFLRRAWELSQDIDFHFQRLQKAKARFPVNEEHARNLINAHLAEGSLFPEQAEAVFHAIKNPIFSIWGGPGTGKTHTAGVFLKVLLNSLTGVNKTKWKVAIAAPTGKATNNLSKSIQKAFGSQELQIDSKTLHAILQIRAPGQSREQETARFLPYDIMVVDESSMIDASLCAKLLSRLADGSRLLFLGDPAQLPPVEPGDPFCQFVNAQGPSLGRLYTSRRTELKTILELAHLVREGKEEETMTFLLARQKSKDGVSFRPFEEASFDSSLAAYAKQLCSEFGAHMGQEEAFAQLGKNQMLSPLKTGPLGTQEINACLHKQIILQKRVCFDPIVMTKNDYQLGLSNGQIGLVCNEETAIFESTDIMPRSIPKVLLSSYEQAYCLSVHKSQGSEFDHVVLLLPSGSEAFGRKMLYTAITRARKSIEIWAPEEVIRAVVRHQ
jgi:exodeoxyribonuclease V alpha subunit